MLEGCSNTEKKQIEKVGCLQAQFGLGAGFSPADFKSPVSTDSTTAAYSLRETAGLYYSSILSTDSQVFIAGPGSM